MWTSFLFVTLLKAAWCLDTEEQALTSKDLFTREFAEILLDFQLGDGSLYNQITNIPGLKKAQNGSHFKDIYSKIRNGMDFEDVLQDQEFAHRLAMISPLYAAKESCLRSSFVFLHSLFIPSNSNFTAAITMLDAASKLPNGILRDSIEYCNYITNILGLRKCPIDKDKLYIPYGNTKSIGNHVQCHKFDEVIPARYCRVGLRRKEGDKLVKPNFGGILSAMNWEWAMCIPKACSPRDVKRNLMFLFSMIKQVKVEVLSCEEPIEYSPSSTPLGIIWCIFLALVLLGTLIDLICLDKSWSISSLKKFSMYRNLKSTVMSEKKPNTTEEISSLGGVLAISLMWIMLSNTLRTFMKGNVINQNDSLSIKLRKNSAPPLYNILMNETLPFDSLFVAFGAGAAYIILKQSKKSAFSFKNFFLDSYIKLTVPILFTYMVMVYYVPSATEGPSYLPINDEGFVNQILHLSNFHFLFYDSQNEDMNYTWFISCLMQLLLIAPLILLPSKKYPKLSMALWVVLMAFSFVLFEGIIFLFNFPPSLLSSSFETQSKFTKLLPINFYQLPLARIQPFLIGILVGFISLSHDRKKIEISKVLNIGMWMVALISIGFSMGSTTLFSDDTIYGKSIWKADESVIYTLLIKVIWSIGIAWIIFACHLGYGGFINTLLSWGPFLVISRTLVSAYLIHNAVITVVHRTAFSSYEFTGLVIAQYFNAIATISVLLSILMHAVVVEPFLNSNDNDPLTESQQEKDNVVEEAHDDQQKEDAVVKEEAKD